MIFYITIYNNHNSLSVTRVPKLLVLQSINYGAIFTKENGIASFCLLNKISLLNFERLYMKIVF